ncbi:MAG: replication-associated recombination protein A [Actinomycetales bacterium]
MTYRVDVTLFDDRAPTWSTPMADRLRPRTLEEVVGQDAVLAADSPIRRVLAEGTSAVSLIIWGPPGSGKTTLARLATSAGNREFVQLSAVTSGVKEVRDAIEQARRTRDLHGRQTVLFVDEVHRFSKSQQDALLPAVEHGWVTLIAATTENPSFSVVAPLLSRSLLVRLEPLSTQALRTLIDRALIDPRGLAGRITLTAEAIDHVIRMSGGDARQALTVLEAAALVDGTDTGPREVDLAAVERAVLTAAPRYDREGDQHYDVISAFIKSVRGSDPDAALHYLARMIEAGEDPRFIARRLMILASEDIGMADPTALMVTASAAQAVALIGMPEARLILAQATIHASLAPKSNAVLVAMNDAQADIRRGSSPPVPAWLRDGHYQGAAGLGHGTDYRYPHSEPEGVSEQVYLPVELVGREYYRPTMRGQEARWGEIAARIARLRQGNSPGQQDDVGAH